MMRPTRPARPTLATTRLAVAVIAALLLGACAHAARTPPADSGDPMPMPPDDTQFTGKVAVTGTAAERYITLQVDGARPVMLVGELASELRRLSGATVRVAGSEAGTGPLGRRVDVRRYDVLSINGQTPSVGILLSHDSAMWLAAADTVQLTAVPDALWTQAGAKVWIVGRRTDRGLAVQSYGVLRPAPE